ncbi:hypothetical protein EZV62_027225 [Acer yangbiense]|uniref:Chromo domain-containing protein n=1 Tax=Acer yangbiense TaxID=1000413 RepID=A0A5C7GT44_9ROSI|nr:hypothetical protein EZV62_027225 [Acer yangbiense]
MRKDIKPHIRTCDICQRMKNESISPHGLLQSLPIATVVWLEILMDFIEALPKSNGYTVILVVVDRCSKYGHFIPLAHPYTASTVAQAFFDCPKDWSKWIPFVEFWHNTNYHESTKKSPFEILYHLPSPRLLNYIHGTSRIDVVDDLLVTRESVLERISAVTYKLDLLASSRVHPVFHVSLLKKKLGAAINPIPSLPPTNDKGQFYPQPEQVLQCQMKKVNNHAITKVLIKWCGQTDEEATWEIWHQMKEAYPYLVGKVL